MVPGLKESAAEEIDELAHLIYSAREFEPNDPGYCLFIGSGCSLPIAPSSQKLADTLLEEMFPKTKPEERHRVFHQEFPSDSMSLDHISLEDVSDAYKTKKGDEALQRFLKVSFSKINNSSKGYEALASLVKAGYFKLIFTTNLDKLIENAFQKIGVKFDLFDDSSDYSKRPSLDKVVVYKLHGSYDKVDLDIGWRDVKQLHPRKQFHLRHFFESNNFVFAGYSGADMDILRCLQSVDPDHRKVLRIYSFTRSGNWENMKRLLRQYHSERGNVALGNVTDGGTFLFTLHDEIKNVEEKEKNG